MCCLVCDKEINIAIMCEHKWAFSIYVGVARYGGAVRLPLRLDHPLKVCVKNRGECGAVSCRLSQAERIEKPSSAACK